MTEELRPAIVQDADDGRVLMLAWMNADAERLTRETGRVHFWSRSRQRLWMKGETSGHVLTFVSITEDCDRDALLVVARPSGPVCHTGASTCWHTDSATTSVVSRSTDSFAALDDLWATIVERDITRPDGSYTVRLLADGPDLSARKVVEEATEVLMAAKDHANGVATDNRLADEMADLVYHLLVLLRERGLHPSDVLERLEERSTSQHSSDIS